MANSLHKAPPLDRLDVVDAARGIAILAMFVYHLAWNMAYFGYLGRAIVEDPLWRGFAISIAASFLFLVGVSLVLATRNGVKWRRFFWRLGFLIVAAGLVTGATYVLFPNAFIFFGILHAIALSSLLGLVFLKLPLSLVAIAALAVFLAPAFFADPYFNSWAWRWLGLMTYFPQTNDYEPILPWFSATLTGILAARMALKTGLLARLAAWRASSPPAQLLCFGGRNSLVIYLLHQPVFFGLVWVVAVLAPAPGFGPLTAERFQGYCQANCTRAGVDGAAFCRAFCACVETGLTTTDLLLPLVENRLSEADQPQLGAISTQCVKRARSQPDLEPTDLEPTDLAPTDLGSTELELDPNSP